MTKPMTLEEAIKLADQDSPLPSLAGPALKRMRQEINHYKGTVIHEEAVHDALLKIMRLLGIVGGTPAEIAREVEKRLTAKADEVARLSYPVNKNDSATLTALITELRMREVVGRAKYGTDVDRTDLTNAQWRQHLREELMDALLYSLAEERTAGVMYSKTQWTDVELAEIAKPGSAIVYGIDKGTNDKTVEVFGYNDAKGVLHIEDIVTSEQNSPNSGHGHVRPRPDGLKARCGGPMLCRICAKELAEMFEVPSDNKCWCSTCCPITASAMRMVLCPTCGNKRCPHAHDHRNACTGSNAVGQPGSSWEHATPITPSTPKDC